MRIDRLIGIIMVLLQTERLGAQEIADLFGVSHRTIYRDLEAISDEGVPIRSTPGLGGGFEILPEYKAGPSADGPAALLTGLSKICGVVRDGELADALEKVRGLLPADQPRSLELNPQRMRIDLSPWTASGDVQSDRDIAEAQDRKLLSFEYVDRHGNGTAQTAEPRQLVLKDGCWYFQGCCHRRNDYRLFRLTRMANMQMSQETFPAEESARPGLDFSEAWESIPTRIKLRIHRSALDQALDFCTFEHFTPDGEEHYIVDFPFVEGDCFYGILLGFGDRCECLEPANVRAELKRRAQAIAALY